MSDMFEELQNKAKQPIIDAIARWREELATSEAKRALERNISDLEELLKNWGATSQDTLDYQQFLTQHSSLQTQIQRYREQMEEEISKSKSQYQLLAFMIVFLLLGLFYSLIVQSIDKSFGVVLGLGSMAAAALIFRKMHQSYENQREKLATESGLNAHNFMLLAFFPMLQIKAKNVKLAGQPFFQLANLSEPSQWAAYDWNEFEIISSLSDNLLITKSFDAPFKSQLLLINKRAPIAYNPKFEQHFHYFPDFEEAFVCCSNQRGEAAAFLEKNEELIWEIAWLLGGASFVFANHKLFCWVKNMPHRYFSETPEAESELQFCELRNLQQALELIRKIKI